MSISPERTFPFSLSLKHLLLVAYFLLLAVLLGWMGFDEHNASSKLYVTSVEVSDQDSQPKTVVFKGEGFNNGIRGYSVKTIPEYQNAWDILTGKSVRAINSDGGIILASIFLNKLVSIDISDDQHPVILDSIELPGPITVIKIMNNRALVGMSKGEGVAIVDLEKPSAMGLIKHIPVNGPVSQMTSVGTYIYFADVYTGLSRIDLSRDDAILESVFSIEKGWRLASMDRFVAVGTLRGDVYLLNVARNNSVEAVAALHLDQDQAGDIRGIAFAGKTLMVFFADKKVRLYPLAGESTFSSYKSLTLPSVPFKVVELPNEQSVIVSLMGSGVARIDVPSADTASVSGHFVQPTTVLTMDADEKFMYLSGQGNHKGVSAIPLSRIKQYSVEPSKKIDIDYQTFHQQGGQVFGYSRGKKLLKLGRSTAGADESLDSMLFAGDNDGVGVYVSADNTEKDRHGTIVDANLAIDALKIGETFLLLHKKGLKIFAGPDINELELISELAIEGTPVCMKALPGDHLVVGTRYGGLQIIDISNRLEPVAVADLLPPHHLQTNSVARDILLRDSYAYVSMGTGGVYVINVENPEKPTLIQVIDAPGKANGMVIYEDLLLVAVASQGVFMFDVRDNRRAVPIGLLPSPVSARSLAIVEDGLIVSGHPGGTYKLPLPRKLKSVGFSGAGELLVELAEEGANHAYLYDNRNSVQVPLKVN